METETIGRLAFVIFILIAIIMGLLAGSLEYVNSAYYDGVRAYVTLIMLMLGIIVGLINITAKEMTPFLIAAVALIVATATNVWSPLGVIHPLLYYFATEITHYIVAFTAPAAFLNAIKAVFILEREK